MRCPIISTCLLYRGDYYQFIPFVLENILVEGKKEAPPSQRKEIEQDGLELNGRVPVIFIPLIYDGTVHSTL